MLRYKLRTLLIVLALGPPVLAGLWFAAPVLPEVLQALLALAFWVWIFFVFFMSVFTLAGVLIERLGNRPK